MGQSQGAGEGVIGEAEAGLESLFAAAEPRGVRANGRGDLGACHLLVILPSDRRQNNMFVECIFHQCLFGVRARSELAGSRREEPQ